MPVGCGHRAKAQCDVAAVPRPNCQFHEATVPRPRCHLDVATVPRPECQFDMATVAKRPKCQFDVAPSIFGPLFSCRGATLLWPQCPGQGGSLWRPLRLGRSVFSFWVIVPLRKCQFEPRPQRPGCCACLWPLCYLLTLGPLCLGHCASLFGPMLLCQFVVVTLSRL